MILVGHRGASAYEPENTLRAFKKALELGANAIEMDVRATADKKIVVIHDSDVDRTTNGRGLVKIFTLEQIKKLDAGKGEKILTLKEALDALKGKCTILVEIKDAGIEKEVVDAVKDVKDVIITSFDKDIIRNVKFLNPNMQAGLIFREKINNLDGFFRLNKAIKSNWLVGKYDIVNKEFIDEAHKNKFNVLVWVIDTKTFIKTYERMGVDGIASNKPDLFKDI